MSIFDGKLVHGNRDIIEQLEQALEAAKAGEIEAVIIVGCTVGDGLMTGGCGWQGAFNNGMLFPWSRMIAAIASAQAELIATDLDTWQ